ncbi:MAG: carboxypeptidase regulatory-like domain-containing protein, partial [Myxococcales bacterium]|nr:carboxypeptidase regulatory-like domain-containing protein [Myxococcales bacterium]
MKRWGVSFILICVAALIAVMAWGQCRSNPVAQRGKPARPLPHAAIAKAIAGDGSTISDSPPTNATPMRGALVLQGVVVDGEGEPVADAVVTWAGAVPISEIRTEADGWFSLEGLGAGGYLLSAQVQRDDGVRLVGYVHYQLGTLTEPAVIVVRPGVAVTVDVRHRGEPVVGAEVAIEGVIAARGVTDAAGSAIFSGMLPGAVKVGARADGLAQAARYAHVPRTGARVQIDMIAAASLRGVVSDETGAAVVGAQIAVARPDLTFGTGGDAPVAVTDANGEFIARVVAGDAVRLVATHPDFLRGYSEPLIANGEASPASASPPPLRITLVRGAALRGRVVDATGAGVAARVTLFEEPSNEVMRRERHTNAGADGTFIFATVQAGAVSLQAATEGARSELWSAEAVPSAEVALVVAHALAIEGTVMSRAGLPVAGAHVTAYREASSDLDYGGELAAVTDADGRFRLYGASADDYRLVAFHAEADVDLHGAAGAVTAKGGARGVVLTYDDLAEVVGTVVGAAPNEEVVVQLGSRSVVAKDGVFVVRDVSPGRPALQVRIDNVQVAFLPYIDVTPPRVDVGEVALAPAQKVRGVVLDA